ncbi:hypothetical protein GCM10027605_44790 [Micromonospora zhanjiangensis]
MFDEDNLVSHAGLVPLMELAEQAGLSRLLDEHVRFGCERVKSGAANSTPKLTSIIAGMACGADGIDDRCFIDIDSLLRPVYGHAKQGASFGHTKIAGKTILRRGLSPLAVTISTETAAPVVAGVRLRAGRAGSSRGAASMVTEAINTAIAAGAQASDILVRGDSAYCAGKIVTAVVKAGAMFSFAIARNPAVDAAIASIHDEQYQPVRYPGAVVDPDTGQLISDAHGAEVEFTAFAGTRHEITGRLVVRRVLDANIQDPLFPVWRYHPFFTNNTEPVAEADITPAGTLTDTARYTVARGATLRTNLINIPARLARPQRRPMLHLPAHWPRAHAWLAFWKYCNPVLCLVGECQENGVTRYW